MQFDRFVIEDERNELTRFQRIDNEKGRLIDHAVTSDSGSGSDQSVAGGERILPSGLSASYDRQDSHSSRY